TTLPDELTTNDGEPTSPKVDPTNPPEQDPTTSAPAYPTTPEDDPTTAPEQDPTTSAPIEPTTPKVDPTNPPSQDPTTPEDVTTPESDGDTGSSSQAPGFQCPDRFGYYPHEICWKFWQCSNWKAYEMDCAPGTQWNQSILTCDHLRDCTRPSTPTTPVLIDSTTPILSDTTTDRKSVV